jgi:hypothetical protein
MAVESKDYVEASIQVPSHIGKGEERLWKELAIVESDFSPGKSAGFKSAAA